MTATFVREYVNVGGAAVRYRPATSLPPGQTKPRDQLQVGVDDPAIPGNCGLTGVPLVQNNTAVTYGSTNSGTSSAPTIIQNQQFNRKISLSNVQYITFRNCWFRGDPTTAIEMITSTNAGNLKIRFEDCLFDPQNPQYRTNANRGTHHTAYVRCEFRHLIDGAAHTNSAGHTGDQQVSFELCWAHDYWYASPDPDAAGGLPDNASHVDMLIQWRGGGGLYVGGCRVDGTLSKDLENYGTQIADNTGFGGGTRVGSDANRMSLDAFIAGQWRHVRGNKYFDYQRTARNADGTGNAIIDPPTLLFAEKQMLQATSLFMFSPNLGALGGMVFEKNWLDGGAACFNFNPEYASVDPHACADVRITPGVIKIINNIIGPVGGQAAPSMRNGPTWVVVANPGLPITMTGNTRTDTGAAWNQRINGGTG